MGVVIVGRVWDPKLTGIRTLNRHQSFSESLNGTMDKETFHQIVSSVVDPDPHR